MFYIPGKTQNPKQNKSKNKDTRGVCLEILIDLLKSFQPKEMCDFLGTYL